MGVEVQNDHVEEGESRKRRDVDDVQKLVRWFTYFNPFQQSGSLLYSLSTGATVPQGLDINCDDIKQIGLSLQQKFANESFLNVKLEKKEQVKTVIKLSKGVVSDKKQVYLDNTILFSRLIILAERKLDVQPPFAYELTSQLASLFKKSQMRKPVKAGLTKTSHKKQAFPLNPLENPILYLTVDACSTE
jgi:capsule polysaccharide export protein KpsC/LpsZ